MTGFFRVTTGLRVRPCNHTLRASFLAAGSLSLRGGSGFVQRAARRNDKRSISRVGLKGVGSLLLERFPAAVQGCMPCRPRLAAGNVGYHVLTPERPSAATLRVLQSYVDTFRGARQCFESLDF